MYSPSHPTRPWPLKGRGGGGGKRTSGWCGWEDISIKKWYLKKRMGNEQRGVGGRGVGLSCLERRVGFFCFFGWGCGV